MADIRVIQRLGQEIDHACAEGYPHVLDARRHAGWGIHYERSTEENSWEMARDFYKAALGALSKGLDDLEPRDDNFALITRFKQAILERRNATAKLATEEALYFQALQDQQGDGEEIQTPPHDNSEPPPHPGSYNTISGSNPSHGNSSNSLGRRSSVNRQSLSRHSLSQVEAGILTYPSPRNSIGNRMSHSTSSPTRSPQRKKFSRGLFRKAIGASSLADKLEDEEHEGSLWGYARDTGLSSRIKDHFHNQFEPSDASSPSMTGNSAATLLREGRMSRSELDTVDTLGTVVSTEVEKSLGRLSTVETTKELTVSSNDWVAPATMTMESLDTLLGQSGALHRKGPMSRSESIELYECVLHCAMYPLRHPDLLQSTDWLRSLWTHLSHDEHNQIIAKVKKAKAKDVAISYLECRLSHIRDHPYYTSNEFASHYDSWVERETQRLEAYIIKGYGPKTGLKKVQGHRDDPQRWANSPTNLIKALKAKNKTISTYLTNSSANHVDMYRHLLKLFTSIDLKRGQTLSLLSPIAQKFLEEYGERYGCNQSTRLLLYLEALVDRLDLTQAHLSTIAQTLSSLLQDYVQVATLSGSRARPHYLTRSETMMYTALVKKLIYRLETRITAFRDYFEDSSSHHALQEAISLLDLAHSAAETADAFGIDRLTEDMSRDRNRSLSTYRRDDLWTFVQRGNQGRYVQLKEAIVRVQNLELDVQVLGGVSSRVGRAMAPSVDDQVADTVMGPVELLRICDFIRSDLDDDAEKFQHCFPFVDQELNLVSVSTKCYYQLLLDDVNRYLKVFRSQPPTADTFALAAKLKDMHSTLYIYDKREEFEPLFMQFAPFVESWTESTGEKLNSWIVSACVLDKWEPLSDSPAATPISTCVVDTYAAIDQACRLYREHSYLDRPPAPSELASIASGTGTGAEAFSTRRFMSAFGDMINDAIQVFADHVLHSLSTELPLDENKKPRLKFKGVIRALNPFKRFTLGGMSDGISDYNSKQQKRMSSRIVQAVGRKSIANFSDRFAEHKERIETQTIPEKMKRQAEFEEVAKGVVTDEGAWVCKMPGRDDTTPPRGGTSPGVRATSANRMEGKGSPNKNGSPTVSFDKTTLMNGGGDEAYGISRAACVRLNNLEAARVKLDEFCSQVEEDFCQIMYHDDGKPVYQYEKAFVSSRFKPAFQTLKIAITASVDIVAYWLNPAILEALDSLISLEDEYGDLDLDPEELYAPTQLVEQKLWPIIDFLEGQLGTLFGNLYHNVGQRVIRRIWELLVEDVEQMLCHTGSSDMSLTPLQASIIDQSLQPLRDFFHAEGQGIPRGFLEKTTAGLQRVLQLYPLPTLSLIQLYKNVCTHESQNWLDQHLASLSKGDNGALVTIADPWEFIQKHVERRPEGYVDSVALYSTGQIIKVLKTRKDDRAARRFIDLWTKNAPSPGNEKEGSTSTRGADKGVASPSKGGESLGIHAGYLQLRRPQNRKTGKKWRRFYFLLEQNRMLFCPTLAYFDSHEAAIEKRLPIGNVILDQVKSITTSTNERGFFQKFTIDIETDDDVYILAAPSAQERSQWAHHLQTLVAAQNE